jgi:lysophospholipase L1-like esterase
MLNYGIGGDPTEGLVIRTERVVALKPDKVFIEAGANDVYFGMEDSKTIANFETILKQLSEELPKAEVYVLSIFPNDLPSPRSNASSFIWIEQLNKELKQLCDKRSVPFIDLSATLELERALNPAYDSGDRIHLNEAGYNKVVEAISPYLQAD